MSSVNNRRKKIPLHKKIAFFIICLFSLYIIFYISGASSSVVKSTQKDTIKNINPYENHASEIPLKLDFAEENVPLERLDVRESLDRELLVNSYWHSQTFLFFKRAYRYFPTIEPILKKNGIPDDFKYLALIESGLANVISPSGATGYWQFIESTGSKMGLLVNDEVDERYHLEKSTEAVCKYLKNSYSIFKSWTLAAAAYNMGDTGLSSQVKSQKVTNYYDLLLNTETARYVFRILAVKTIFNAPRKYGFYFENYDLYPPVKTESVVVDTAIKDLAQFALDKGINYKILKEYNPWLRKSCLTNKTRKTFYIQIPYADELLYKKHFPVSSRTEIDNQ